MRCSLLLLVLLNGDADGKTHAIFSGFSCFKHAIGTGAIFGWTKYHVQICQAYEGSVTVLSRYLPGNRNNRRCSGETDMEIWYRYRRITRDQAGACSQAGMHQSAASQQWRGLARCWRKHKSDAGFNTCDTGSQDFLSSYISSCLCIAFNFPRQATTRRSGTGELRTTASSQMLESFPFPFP